MGFLRDVENRLDLPSGQKSDVMREIGEHYDDLLQELDQGWQRESELDRLIAQRLGTPEEIAARMNAVHNSASWGSTVLAVLPFAASLLVRLLPSGSSLRIAAIAVILAITTAASLRELVLGRRPVWLPAWLATSLLSAVSLIHYFRTPPDQLSDSFVWLWAAALGLCLLAPAACWRIRPWRETTLAISLVAVPCALHMAMSATPGSAWFPSVIVAFLAILVQCVFFARGLFEKHPYGNGFRASLFLLAAVLVTYCIVDGVFRTPVTHIVKLACLAPAAWAIRDPRPRFKDKAIRVMVFLYALLSLTDPSDVAPGFSFTQALGAILGWLFSAYIAQTVICGLILFPMWRDRQRREEEQRMTRLQSL